VRRHWLAVPDGNVSCAERLVAAAVARVMATSSPSGPLTETGGSPAVLCVAPFEGDGHPDHEATGRAALSAAAAEGVPLLRYPVWAWHWATPGGGDLPLSLAAVLPLPAGDRRRKADAIAAHRSQLVGWGSGPDGGPVLTERVLAHFRRPVEVFLR
jgi:LmbE family N-acetylglucosaminyl deacetylase